MRKLLGIAACLMLAGLFFFKQNSFAWMHGSPGTAPFQHFVVVLEENTNYADVIGNSSAPYFNSLANTYGLATQYYADTHPSIGNYFMLTTGQIITNDDTFSSTVSVDNIVRRLLASGKTWKEYSEDLPSVGYTGGDVNNLYIQHHNPLSYFSDVRNNSAQLLNLVPLSQFTTDLANNALPTYSFIVPNQCNNAHDCPLSTADSWLQSNIGPLISNSTLMQNTLVIIVFDEALTADTTNGGGRVYWVAVSPKVKSAYTSTTLYQHESTLRESLEGLGLQHDLGAAATAPNMSEFFQ
jgi:phosphatidylinositol-3-phosphatase